MSSNNNLCTVNEFVAENFHYLIIGGGTAGLTLASRLSEDPLVNVGVIEAGDAALQDPAILTPGNFTRVIGRECYDWMMTSVPQVALPSRLFLASYTDRP
jgi:choline dehydrogenase-like flavoprotein